MFKDMHLPFLLYRKLCFLYNKNAPLRVLHIGAKYAKPYKKSKRGTGSKAGTERVSRSQNATIHGRISIELFWIIGYNHLT